MGQRIILSENEKRNIQKMYGIINEQNINIFDTGGRTQEEIEAFMKKNGGAGFFDSKTPNPENFEVINNYDGGQSKSKIGKSMNIAGYSFLTNYYNSFKKGQVVKAIITGPKGSKSKTYTAENDGYGCLTIGLSKTEPGNYKLTIDGDDKNSLDITVK